MTRSGRRSPRWRSKLGCTAETLRKWVRQAERDRGVRAGLRSDERERLKALEREVRELRRANEIEAQGVGVFCPGGARPPRELMMSFIDEHRGRYGVGPIGAQVPLAPSTYSAHKGREAEPERAPARVRRDGWLSGEIGRVYDEPFEVYGVRKVWRPLRREGVGGGAARWLG